MITPHTPKTSNYKKQNACLTYKNDESIIKWNKANCKSRSIKEDDEESEEDLTETLSEQKPKINLSKKKIKEIKKDFSELRRRFSK